jgi:hypothetical protein
MAARKLLPIVQFVAYLLIIWFGCPYRDTWTQWLTSTGGFMPSWIDGPPSILEQFALGINLPAVLLLPILALFQSTVRTGAGQELLMHIVTAIAVPGMWYLIGRWIDNRDAKLRLASRAAKLCAWAGVICLGTLATFVLASFFLGGREFVVERLFALLWISGGIYLVGMAIGQSPTSQAAA